MRNPLPPAYKSEFHKTPIADLLQQIDATARGLSTDERATRLSTNGPNLLEKKKKHSVIFWFFRAQIELFSGLLWAATIICFVVFGIARSQNHFDQDYNLYLGVALIALNLVSGAMQLVQHVKADRQMVSFQSLIPQQSIVLTHGVEEEVPSQSLVTGDVLVLKRGMRCAADVRLIQSMNLQVDTASFTGEAEPMAKKLICDSDDIVHAENVVLSGCGIILGEGVGIVCATGSRTYLGQYYREVDDVHDKVAPIQTEIHRLVKFITLASIGMGVAFFALSMGFKINVITSFIFSVGIIVANVPEGMSLAITVALGSAAKRLFKLKLLVKSLNDVATLGAISVICTDKTGTLTYGQMTVQSVSGVDGINSVAWETNKCSCSIDDMQQKILTLNSMSQFDEIDPETDLMKKRIIGDASESAILRFITTLYDSKYDILRQNTYILRSIPFDSSHKLYVIEVQNDSTHLVTLKGAAEKVLSLCDTLHDTSLELTYDRRATILQLIEQQACKGERIIGLAYSNKDFNNELTIANVETSLFTFAGFISLQDPPREGVVHSIYECHDATVQVVMVTGDHPSTAEAIAKQIGILNGDVDYYLDRVEYQPDVAEVYAARCSHSPYQAMIERIGKYSKEVIPEHPALGAVISGVYLDSASDYQLLCLTYYYKELVFARTSPSQKLKIVTAFYKLQRIVAVTGDGLNDAPALRKADVGVAMASGCAIARDAADLVLAGQSFSGITDAIREGRLVFDNLTKSLCFAITTTMPEVVPFLLFVICGFPNALSPVVIILIDLVTCIWPAFALGSEFPEFDVMLRPPRVRKERIFSWRLARASYIVIGLYQAICLIVTFILTVQGEYFAYTGLTLPLSAFANIHHADFETKTLLGFVALSTVADPAGVAKSIFYAGSTAAFASIVVTQFAHAITGRTRMNSIFRTKLSWRMAVALIIMVSLSMVVVYLKQLQFVLLTRQLRAVYWAYPLPFAVGLVVYDEVRKAALRGCKKGGRVWRALYW